MDNRAQPVHFLFSVVSAVYNAESWLETFLCSITTQSLNFEEHIQLIIADDGSTDSTNAIAQKWVAKYPQNILYGRKENGGAASARNFGLQFATGEWVTFTDPDDFVCESYFATVKNFLENSNFDGHVIAANPIFFMEKSGTFIDEHPLRFKFLGDDKIINIDRQPEYVQLFCSSAFIRMDALRSYSLNFDSRVKPSFEDAHLLQKLLLLSSNRNIAFLKDALYFYRKRADGTGLVDSGWQRPEKYREQIFYGYLDLAKFARQKTGGVPSFIQNAIIYDMQWYVERLLQRAISHVFSDQSFKDFLDITRALFSYIDTEEILFSRLPMLSIPVRIAMLRIFKNMEPPPLPLAVQEVDADCMLAIACSGSGKKYIFYQGAREIAPLWQKTIRYRFRELILCVEQYFRLPVDRGQPLSCSANGQAINLLPKDEKYDQYQ